MASVRLYINAMHSQDLKNYRAPRDAFDLELSPKEFAVIIAVCIAFGVLISL